MHLVNGYLETKRLQDLPYSARTNFDPCSQDLRSQKRTKRASGQSCGDPSRKTARRCAELSQHLQLQANAHYTFALNVTVLAYPAFQSTVAAESMAIRSPKTKDLSVKNAPKLQKVSWSWRLSRADVYGWDRGQSTPHLDAASVQV